MEANPSPRPTAPHPAARRKRPHPAQHARRTAAAVSVGSFLALTGAFAVKTAVTGTATTGASTDTQTTAVTQTDDGSVVIGGQQSRPGSQVQPGEGLASHEGGAGCILLRCRRRGDRTPQEGGDDSVGGVLGD